MREDHGLTGSYSGPEVLLGEVSPDRYCETPLWSLTGRPPNYLPSGSDRALAFQTGLLLVSDAATRSEGKGGSGQGE